MELRQLRYFVEAASAGTYVAAAQRLHLSEPALWKQVNLLEHELGVSLFERAGRRLRLTEAGEVVLERASQIIASADRLKEVADGFGAKRRHVVVIGCAVVHISEFLAPVIAAFERKHPESHVLLRDYPRPIARAGGRLVFNPADDLATGLVDLALTGREATHVDGFGVFELRVIAVLPHDDPRSVAGQVRIQELDKEPLIFPAQGCLHQHLLKQSFEAAGLEPMIAAEAQTNLMALELGRMGRGIPLLLDFAPPLATRLSGVPLAGIDGILSIPISLLWRHGAVLTPSVQALIDEAHEYSAIGTGLVRTRLGARGL